jgi:hypothetical protein
MATKSEGSQAARETRQMFAKLGAAAEREIFAHSVKIVCGKQTDGSCCCVAGTRPGVYATEVNIQNINLEPARVLKIVVPLINSGAVIGREPRVVDPRTLTQRPLDAIELPPLAATMDDCCRVTELLLGATPNGDVALTVAILTIVSTLELSVSAVYTASPLNGEGISIDVEYIQPRRLDLRRQ